MLRPAADHVWETDPSGDKLPVPGSQMLTQTLWLAGGLAPQRRPHSQRARFLRPGRKGAVVRYRLDIVRAGRTMTVIRAVAEQAGRNLAEVDMSFHAIDEDVRHADWHPPGPRMVDPESLARAIVASTSAMAAFDARAEREAAEGGQSIHPYWARHCDALDDDPLLHVALVSFICDIGVNGSAVPPGASLRDRLNGTSLDHTIWFHRAARVDDWLHVSADCVSASDGRGTAIGAVHDRSGRRIASFAQESLLRRAT
jgi:acyl-CoA thioesterase-2